MSLRRIPAWLWILVATVLAAGHCYGWSYGADDVRFVRHYTRVLEAGDVAVRWDAVAADFAGPWGGNSNGLFFRPLVSLSLAIDFALFGLSPAANALVNLLVHLASALCLFALARRILPDKRSALPAALLFALTPLAHENIAWAVGRCGLTVLLSLASALLLLGAWRRTTNSLALHALPLVLGALNLMTMESAVVWIFFPPLCLVVERCFKEQRFDPMPGTFVPYLGLAALYLVARLVLFGGLGAGSSVSLLGAGSPWLAPFELLWESLVPRDQTWLGDGPGSSVFRALCLFPPAVGLAAPLYFKNPRSRAYRQALGLLLGFWLASRLPSMSLRVGADLESARCAYYSYPALLLVITLLAATVRYAVWALYLLAVLFGASLHHRIAERVAWAGLGNEARQAVYAEAEKRGALGDAAATPIAILNQIDGQGGAPVYHPGEIAYVLFPPFVPQRVAAVTVYGFAAGEPGAGAWIAKACGGLLRLPEPPSSQGPVELVRLGATELHGLIAAAPASSLLPRLVDRPAEPFPDLDLATGWPPGAGETAVLLLTAGARAVSTPLVAARGWPPAAEAILGEWARLGGRGGRFAGFVETRRDAARPATVTARSQVFFGRIL